MGNLLDAVIGYLRADEWPFDMVKGENAVHVLFQGEHAQFNCFCEAREEQQQFLFYSLCPVTIPEHKRQEMAEYITRANFDMAIGNFEMDFVDGELRFKTSIDVEGSQLTPELLKPLLYANVLMMDQYLPGMMAIIYADKSPEDAIKQVEDDE